MSSAAFRHGPLEIVSLDMFVLVFGGTLEPGASTNACSGGHGAKAALCAADSALAPTRIPALSESVRPILEILPVQMITLALGALAGLEAGRFGRATKVTTTE